MNWDRSVFKIDILDISGSVKSFDPNVWVYCGHIIKTINPIFTETSYFCQTFEDFTKATQKLTSSFHFRHFMAFVISQ